VEALPPQLSRQRGLLVRLLDRVEPDERFRAMELQCSLPCGAADELSDIDAGLYAADDVWEPAVAAVPELVRAVGATYDPPPLAGFVRARLAEAAGHGISVAPPVLQERHGTAG
jgi:hypothetical protein